MNTDTDTPLTHAQDTDSDTDTPLTHAQDTGAESSTTSGRKLRTVVLSSLLGTTVEWYDFFLYSTAASLVFGKLFFPETNGTVGTMLAFATFAVGFVARPLGGLLFGHIGDRVGRKRTLAFTMGLMGVSTALIGLLPTYGQVGALAPCCCWSCVSRKAWRSAASGPEPYCWRWSTDRRAARAGSAATRRSAWRSDSPSVRACSRS